MTLPLEANIPGSGTLALAGSGEYLPGMDPVDRDLMDRLTGPVQVVCLPTAAGTEGEERIRYWMELGKKHFTGLGAARVEALRVIDRATALDPQAAERIQAANFVYLSGGKPHHLYHSLRDTPVFAAIQAVLERGGVVAGCSAGAMIFGQRIPGSPLPWSWMDGFNYLPGAFIVPHFDELPRALLSGFLPLAGKYTLVGIDGNTALVCNGQGCQVRGQGAVTVVRHAKPVRYVQER